MGLSFSRGRRVSLMRTKLGGEFVEQNIGVHFMSKTEVINGLRFIREQLYGSRFNDKVECLTEAIKLLEEKPAENPT